MSHSHLPGQRPDWWPENEPWPPHGPRDAQAWRRLPRYLIWRLVVLLISLFILLCLLAGALSVLVEPHGRPLPFFFWPERSPLAWLAPLVLFLALFLVMRALSVLTLPVRDLVNAAGRVAAGDYAVRVRARGPRQLRRLAHSFNEMVERLQTHDEQRRRLLADISHELRTPLTVMQGNLEALLEDVYPRDDAHLRPLLEETQLMARLVEDLRTLALAESGALKLEREPTDLGDLLRESAAAFRSQADHAGVSLTVQTEDNLPPVNLDPERMRQVLANLLANALRYTPAGGKIHLESYKQAGELPLVVVVQDTGSGIPLEELPHIFDRFTKGRDSRGSGLGLAIARSLVLAHGGEIMAASQPGQGATFTLRLPAGD